MTIEREKELQRIIDEARLELRELQASKQCEENAHLVGKCFRYRNNYSCPEGPGDFWWLYARVVDITEDGELLATIFERDKYGDIRIRPRTFFSPKMDYQPISPADFAVALSELEAEIAEL